MNSPPSTSEDVEEKTEVIYGAEDFWMERYGTRV
jgi:hypothetical protein